MRLRHVNALDYDRVLAVVDAWWDGRLMSARLSHVFFSHFAPTSFVLESGGELVGFLLGFLSQTHPQEAYVHFVGVHPGYRRLGLGRRLYERFFVAAQMHERRFVRSITAPSNENSIAFHLGMGFEPLHGDVVVDGVPVWFDYAGAGGHRVVFRACADRGLPFAGADRRHRRRPGSGPGVLTPESAAPASAHGTFHTGVPTWTRLNNHVMLLLESLVHPCE